jgi:hypothetical protein
MGISRILYSKNSPIMLSIVVGIGIISLLFSCSDTNCEVEYRGPEKKDLNKVFRSANTCVRIEPKQAKCNNNKKNVIFA